MRSIKCCPHLIQKSDFYFYYQHYNTKMQRAVFIHFYMISLHQLQFLFSPAVWDPCYRAYISLKAHSNPTKGCMTKQKLLLHATHRTYCIYSYLYMYIHKHVVHSWNLCQAATKRWWLDGQHCHVKCSTLGKHLPESHLSISFPYDQTLARSSLDSKLDWMVKRCNRQ